MAVPGDSLGRYQKLTDAAPQQPIKSTGKPPTVVGKKKGGPKPPSRAAQLRKVFKLFDLDGNGEAPLQECPDTGLTPCVPRVG